MNTQKKLARVQLADRKDAAARHSRVPWLVGADHSLERIDLWVYFALASEVWASNVSVRSTRWLAECVKASQSTIVNSLKRLESAGHIEIKETKRGKKAAYVMLSPVFGERDTFVNGNITPISELKRARRPKACGRCGLNESPVGSSGICQNCLNEFAASRAAS